MSPPPYLRYVRHRHRQRHSVDTTPRAPTITSIPVISGNVWVGAVLTCSTGVWDAYPVPTYAYQWRRVDTSADISGATSSTYTPVSGDIGHTLTCVVTPSNGLGSPTPSSAATTVAVIDTPVAPVNTVAPALSTTSPSVGVAVTVTTGTWTGTTPITYSYQWYLDSSIIVGEITNSYTPISADDTHTLKCLVTADNGVGSPATAYSNTSDAVVADSGPSMPSGALGIYYADAATSSPRKTLPNEAPGVTAQTIKSLWAGGRRAFSNIWGGGGAATDNAAVGPDGLTEATVYTNASAGWALSRTCGTLAAGTYTYAVWAKTNNPGVNQSFRMIATGDDTFVATDTWQRFSVSVVLGSPSTPTFFLYNTGAAIDIQFCDADLFAGGTDLGAEGANDGHLEIGLHVHDTPSVTAGVASFPVDHAGYIRFPTDTTFTNGWTTVAIVRNVGGGSTYTTVLSKSRGAYNTIGAHLEFGGNITLAGTSQNQQVAASGKSQAVLEGSGWHSVSHRFDPVNNIGDIWMDGGVVRRASGGTLSVPTAGEFYVNVIELGGGYGGGWDFAALAIFPYALTKQQIHDAETVMAARVLANSSISRSGIRYEFAEGDSLTADGNYPYLYAPNMSPLGFQGICAVPGSTYTTLASRAGFLTDVVPPAPYRVSGSKYILSVMVINGVVNVSTYEPLRTAYWDARKAEGWYIAAGTILPSVDFHGADRVTVNSNIAADLGTRCDTIFDFAADATMGPDAAASDSSLYSDGIHPTLTAQETYLEPIYRATMNAIP